MSLQNSTIEKSGLLYQPPRVRNTASDESAKLEKEMESIGEPRSRGKDMLQSSKMLHSNSEPYDKRKKRSHDDGSGEEVELEP